MFKRSVFGGHTPEEIQAYCDLVEFLKPEDQFSFGKYIDAKKEGSLDVDIAEVVSLFYELKKYYTGNRNLGFIGVLKDVHEEGGDLTELKDTIAYLKGSSS